MRLTRAVIFAVFTAHLGFADGSVRDQGIAEFGQGRYASALQDLQRAVREQPNDPEAAVFLALTQAATGDCAAAGPTLRLTVEKGSSPLDRMAGLAAAKCDSAAGQPLKALSTLEVLEKRYPNDADVLYLSAKIHMKAFNDATFAMFQRAPASFRVHELSAEIFEVQNRYDDAAGEYRKAIELNPNAPDLHFHLGRALILQSHSAEALQQAAQQFRAELQLNPEDSACEFELGQIADVQGKDAEAREHFERAESLSPTFVQALIHSDDCTRATNSRREQSPCFSERSAYSPTMRRHITGCYPPIVQLGRWIRPKRRRRFSTAYRRCPRASFLSS